MRAGRTANCLCAAFNGDTAQYEWMNQLKGTGKSIIATVWKMSKIV